VRRGQVVAVLDRRDRLVAERAQAVARVAIAGARLARVRAGAKAGELAAQRATIDRLSAELEIAESEFARYRGLEAEGAISASLLDSKRVVVATLRGQLNAAREQLTALAEVRPTDVRLAEAELADARAALGRVETDLARSFVRSPLDGQVLQVHARAGEQVGPAGVVELGHTEAMEAVAEVYEDDLARVRIGQRARVRGVNRAFAGELHGTVVRITPRIGKKDVLASDPAADVDARVAEVRVRLDRQDGVRVRGLTNLKIQVEIDG
jgi:HlyD family secretion protein